MSPKTKQEYIEEVLKRYRVADRKGKCRILDEVCIVCKYHRKWAIEKLNTFNAKIPRKKPGRPSAYDQSEIIEPLKEIWIQSHYPASKRLKEIIPDWLPYLPNITKDVRKKLITISAPTIDRLLKASRLKFKPKGLCTTKPGNLLRQKIPIKVNQWDEFKPGFIEADTVAHCGTSVDGHYAVTLDGVDIATGWSEQRATWGFNHQHILEKIKDIEQSLPFKLLGFDSDGGSEFMNYSLLLYLQYRKGEPVQFTRSRAYKKNDNAHVEQKNWTHIRQWLGYERFAHIKVVDLLNDLYKNEWRLFFNFFMPSTKLIAKQRIGSKIIKKHDRPQTPYQRILQSPYIDKKTKLHLTKIRKSLNPFILRSQIDKKLSIIKSLLKSAHSFGKVLL